MIIPTEQWKIVAGFTGYEISSHGRVRTYRPANGRGPLLNKPREVKAKPISGKPYLKVTLTNNAGLQVSKKVHILVLENFVGKRPSIEYEGRHLDGNSFNNHLHNLKWGTTQENADDRLAHGTQVRGEQVAISKLNPEQVQEIKSAIPKWKKGMASEFAKKFGVGRTAITNIRDGKTWRHL